MLNVCVRVCVCRYIRPVVEIMIILSGMFCTRERKCIKNLPRTHSEGIFKSRNCDAIVITSPLSMTSWTIFLISVRHKWTTIMPSVVITPEVNLPPPRVNAGQGCDL